MKKALCADWAEEVRNKFKVYNNSFTPIAVTDKNLGILYKNSCFTEIFGMRTGATLTIIKKSPKEIAAIFEMAEKMKMPLVTDIEALSFPVLLTIVPFQYKTRQLFMIFAADFVLMDESRGFVKNCNNITETKVMELLEICNRYITPFVDDVLVGGFIDEFASPEQKSYVRKNIFKLKMLEYYAYGILRRCTMGLSNPEYALNVRVALGEFSDAIESHAPHGYHLKCTIPEEGRRLVVRDSYSFMSFIICACLYVFRNCGVKNVELCIQKQEESIAVRISAGIDNKQADYIKRRRISREKEYLGRCAQWLGAQLQFDNGDTEIVLKLRESEQSHGDFVLFDPILEDYQKRIIEQAIESFCDFLLLLE